MPSPAERQGIKIADDAPDAFRSSRRREILVVAVLTIIGAGLRLWKSRDLGLSHFDEGVYALAGLWPMTSDDVGEFTQLIPYGPPGFPLLVGLAYLALGISDASAIVVSQLAGILTIPVVAWMGRRAFGPGAGAAAAALAATCGPHVAFSRMALTDVSFLLTWVIALALGARFLERPTWGRAIAMGAAVGVAQNFKYNGWLAGAIIAAVAVLDLMFARREGRRDALRAIVRGLVAVLVAAAVYAPWFVFVTNHGEGGYAGLIRHHRSYMGGFDAWHGHWRLQMAEAVALSGGREWGLFAWILAWFGAAYVANGSRVIASRAPMRVGFAIGLAAGAALLTSTPNLPWWVALGWSPWLVADRRPQARIIGVWWLTVAALTPFYHPYARLWLPTIGAGWLILGGGVRAFVAAREPFVNRIEDEPEPRAASKPPAFSRRHLGVIALVGILCAGLAIAYEHDPRHDHPRTVPDLLGPSNTLQETMAKINKGLPRNVKGLRILGRPTVAFYQGLESRIPFEREENAEALMENEHREVWAIIDETVLHQEPRFDQARRRLLEHWVMITTFPEDLSVPTLLDTDPSAAYSQSPHEQVWLWLVRPRQPGETF